MEKERQLTPERIEYIKKAMQMSIEEKLLWIEEMLKLNELYATKETKEIQKRVRERRN